MPISQTSIFTTVTSNTTLLLSQCGILADTTSGNITLTLPAASTSQVDEVVLKKIASGNTVTITPNGADTIDGASTYTLSAINDFVTLSSDATSTWKVKSTSAIFTGSNLPGSPTTTTQTPGDNSTKIATTAYVDTAVLGQNFKEAVKYATIAALPAVVYANGASGVGATLTGVAFGALGVDSSSPIVGDRILVKNQVSTFQNGLYTVTATGSGIAVFVLTRTTDFNQSFEIKTGDSVFCTAGSTLATTTWAYNGIDNPVMGTDDLTFTQTAGQGSFTAGNGISITGVSIAIDTSVTVDKTTVQTLTNKTLTSPTMTTPVLGTPTSGTLTNCTFPTLNQNTSGSAASLSVSGQTGLMTVTGLASTNRAKTVRDAADTILELGGSYTPTGTWTSLTMVTPVLGTPTSGTLTNCTGLPEGGLSTTDITTNDVTSTKHGFAPKSPADATKYLNGAATPAFATITTIGANSMTLEGISDRVFTPKCAIPDTSLIGTATSARATWHYLGTTATAITPKKVMFYCGSTAGTESAAEVGLFSTPNAPSGAAQTLTKLVSGTVTRNFTASAMNKNTSDFATSIAAGTHLWAGFQETHSVAPTFLKSQAMDLSGGSAMLLDSAASFAVTSSYTTATTSPINAFPVVIGIYLIATLD